MTSNRLTFDFELVLADSGKNIVQLMLRIGREAKKKHLQALAHGARIAGDPLLIRYIYSFGGTRTQFLRWSPVTKGTQSLLKGGGRARDFSYVLKVI